MDVNAMDGTYVDYVENAPALGKEPNALADHTDTEPSPDIVPSALEDRVGAVIKEMIDAGNYFWAGRVADALADNPKKD
jgi:hypothetical protein